MRALKLATVAIGVWLALGCAAPAAPAAPSAAAKPAAAAPAASSGGATAAPVELQKVRMAYAFVGQPTLPMWIALDQGIYRKHGLDVEATVMQTSAQVAPAMAAGEIDVALTAGAGVVDTTLAGGEQVLVESDSNRLRFFLRTQPQVTRVEDLRDKRVAITRLGSGNHLAAQVTLQRAGLEGGRDVQFLQAGSADAIVSALLGGSADGAMMGGSGHLVVGRQGYPLLADTGDYAIPYMQASLAVTRATVATRYDLVRSYVRAHLEAVGLGKRDAELSKRLLQRHLQLDDPELLEANYRLWLEDLDDPPYPPLAAVQTVLDQRADEIPAARAANPRDFIDDRILRELDSSGYMRQALGPPYQR